MNKTFRIALLVLIPILTISIILFLYINNIKNESTLTILRDMIGLISAILIYIYVTINYFQLQEMIINRDFSEIPIVHIKSLKLILHNPYFTTMGTLDKKHRYAKIIPNFEIAYNFNNVTNNAAINVLFSFKVYTKKKNCVHGSFIKNFTFEDLKVISESSLYQIDVLSKESELSKGFSLFLSLEVNADGDINNISEYLNSKTDEVLVICDMFYKNVYGKCFEITQYFKVEVDKNNIEKINEYYIKLVSLNAKFRNDLYTINGDTVAVLEEKIFSAIKKEYEEQNIPCIMFILNKIPNTFSIKQISETELKNKISKYDVISFKQEIYTVQSNHKNVQL